MKLYDELRARGLLAQTTNEEAVREMMDGDKPVTFYIGFDATAESLHVGHFLQLVVIRHMQRAGHRPIALLGTGTTMVGDPTGKTDMRKMLSVEEINYNADRFLEQISKFVDFSDGKALVRRNGDWLLEKKYIEFLREIGVYFTVNKMLTYECFKSRWERGLSFIEFNYMLMQSYDFLHLFRTDGCTLELGGDDQWANILAGVDLVRRVTGKEVFGQTFTLLTTKEGKKMGKTENGAIWLNPAKTTPYEFYQYWRNVDDGDVINCLKMLTFLPLEEIAVYEKMTGSALNEAKERLAYELTMDVHGREEADKAREVAKSLFASGSDDENMPTSELSEENFTDNKIDVLSLMVQMGLTASKSEARRLVQQGGVTLDGEKCDDIAHLVDIDEVKKGLVVRKGKKTFRKAVLKD